LEQTDDVTAIKVIVLAAGEGSRLRPYTLDRPKCMVEIDGKSLLKRQLDVLNSRGLKRIVIVAGYRADQLERFGLALRLNLLYAETNMVWSLFCADDELEGDVVIAYGDIVYSREILDRLLQSTADLAVAIDLNWERYWRARNEDPLADAETLKLDGDGRILEIGQRPKRLEEIQGQYMGLMKFSAKGLGWLKAVYQEARSCNDMRGKLPEKAYMTDLLQTMIDKGFPVIAVPITSAWVEVDTVEDRENPVTKDRLLEIERSCLHQTPC
jgi:choline kinase